VHLLAVDPQPVRHYTVWENIGYGFLLSGIIFLVLCYWLGFKIKAKCLVIGSTTKKPCPNDGTVVLGCRRHHRWKKPVAWVRHMGAASWLDPWLYRLNIVPPSFAPMPMPAVAAPTAEAPSAPPGTPGSRMTLEAKIAVCSLVFGIIQAGTGVIALVIVT
jgi:hypothetical protein